MPPGHTDPHPASPPARTLGGASLVVSALLAVLAAALLLGGPLAGQADAAAPRASAGCTGTAIDKTVTGMLTNSAADGAPVPDVKITVTNCDGKTFEGRTTADGRFSIKITAGIGPVTVVLDPETLPDGVTMRPGAPTTNTLTGSLSILNTTFRIGPDDRKIETKWDQVPSLVYNGLLFGLIIALASLGLSMVFGTTGLTNFAHGELVSFGAIVTYWLSTTLGLPFLAAIPLAVLLGMVFGYVQDTILWRPLRRRGTGLIAAMIVSIGLQFFLRNGYAYLTGSRTDTYNSYFTPSAHTVLGVDVTVRDLVIALVCIVVLGVVIAGLSFTRIGRATRAVADNPALAASTGINVDRVISVVWIVGTGLATLSGVFLGFQLGVTYQIGQLVLLLLFAAVTVGGLGSIWGAVLGSLIIGVLINLTTLVINADLKNAGALLLLIVILLVRPQGLLGRRERIG